MTTGMTQNARLTVQLSSAQIIWRRSYVRFRAFVSVVPMPSSTSFLYSSKKGLSSILARLLLMRSGELLLMPEAGSSRPSPRPNATVSHSPLPYVSQNADSSFSMIESFTPICDRSCAQICAISLEPASLPSMIVVSNPLGSPAWARRALARVRSNLYIELAAALYQGADGRYRDWVAGARPK